jgi:hypothetical protein
MKTSALSAKPGVIMNVQRLAVVAAAALSAAVMACSPSTAVRASLPGAPGAPGAPGVTVGPVTDISGASCDPSDAEVEEAAWRADVYAAWICQAGVHKLRIGFARSTDAGKTWDAPIIMPASAGGWDPAVAVAPDGTLYVSFMNSGSGHAFPVVEVSRDQGRTFPSRASLVPAPVGNWGDRDFITAGPRGLVYLTWDYAPTAKYLKLTCPPGGSCSFAAGEFNAVLQKSTDFGRTWGPITQVSPGFPASGADMAPLLIGRGGRVDVVYQDLAVINHTTFALGPAHMYFTSSADGGRTWSRPVRIGPSAGAIPTTVWWIDGAIAADAAGNLYITWDTRGNGRDTGWLSYSTDGGKAWSAPLRVTPDNTAAVHITQSAGGAPGIDYVGWLSDSSPRGYAQYLRVFQIGRGWLDGPVQVSRQFGLKSVWPGDTFGIATLPGGAANPRSLVLTWGSAVNARSQIYAAQVGI